MELYKGQLKDYKFNIKKSYSSKKDEEGHHIKIYKCFDIFTFDTEASSAWIDENGNVIGYRKGESEDYWNSLTPLALTYIWQFSVNGIVYYGREIDTFIKLCDDLPEADMLIFVHNLSYDFNALCDIFSWERVFARSPRKPILSVPAEYKHITFKCSYALTNLSLDSWGKELGFPKLTGLLDYTTLYTPLSELPQDVLDYSERDVQVMYKGLSKLATEYGNIFKVPMTATGRVRTVIKNLLTSDLEYRRYIKKLVPKNIYEYNRLQHLFAGGLTRSIRLYSNRVIYAKDYPQYGSIIEHYDFTSSYPTVFFEKFPCSSWTYQASLDMPDESEFENNAYIFEVTFYNIYAKGPHSYLQASKCEVVHPVYDNGRLLGAEVVKTIINEDDYLIIKSVYDYDQMEIHRIWRSRKDYLPKAFLEYVLELYYQKTAFKGLPDMEDEYMNSKRSINSLFGMMVTALLQADIKLINDEWIVEPLTAESVQNKLNNLSDWHDKERRYFLNYSWGIWTTSKGRRRLMEVAMKCDLHADKTGGNHLGMDVLYMDTDSIFCIGKHDYEWYNIEVTNMLKTTCDALGLDFNKTRPKDKKGIERPLGLFLKETDITEFIGIHAKCYCCRYVYNKDDPEADGQLHMTISGINKGAVELLDDNIENFKPGFRFDKDAACVKKRLSTYLSSQPIVTYPDGYVSHQQHGVNMRNTGYKISITDEYEKLLEYSQNDIILNDEAINRLRGAFIC